MMILFLGGWESTAGLTGSLALLLAENPDQRALAADPSLIPAAVEEALRLVTPCSDGPTTSREVTLHGVRIPKGGRVVLIPGAANRDERQFPAWTPSTSPGPGPPSGLRRGRARLPGARLPAWRRDRASVRPCPSWATTSWRAWPASIRSSPNMYVWKHLPATFGRSEAIGRTSRPSTTGRRPSPSPPGVRGGSPGHGQARGRRRCHHAGPARRRRAPPAALGGGRARRPRARRRTHQAALRAATLPTTTSTASASSGTRRARSSLHVHDRLAVGDTVRLRGPRNNFPRRSRPVPVHRRWYRHHADPRDIRTAEAAGAERRRLVYGGRRRPPWPSSTNWRATASGSRSTRRTRPACSTSTPARHSNPTPRTVRGAARRGRAARHGLAPAVAARRTLRAEAAGRAGAPRPRWSCSRASFTLTVLPERSVLSVEEAGSARSSCAEGTVPANSRSWPRNWTTAILVLDEAVKSVRERRHDDLRLPCVHRASGAGPVSGVEDRPVGVASSGRGDGLLPRGDAEPPRPRCAAGGRGRPGARGGRARARGAGGGPGIHRGGGPVG